MATSAAVQIDTEGIQAAVFDFGGVLIEGGPAQVVAFGGLVGLDDEQWRPMRRELFGNDGIWAELERGEKTFAAFLGVLKAKIEEAGGSVSLDQAASFMGDPEPLARATRVRAEVVSAVRDIRRRMPTALLTNNIKEWRTGWQSILDIEDLFDVVVDSSVVGTRKPEPGIYELTRERLDVPHEAIFFLDDIGQNLKAARALGWQTLLYTETETVLPVLRQLANGSRAGQP